SASRSWQFDPSERPHPDNCPYIARARLQAACASSLILCPMPAAFRRSLRFPGRFEPIRIAEQSTLDKVSVVAPDRAIAACSPTDSERPTKSEHCFLTGRGARPHAAL